MNIPTHKLEEWLAQLRRISHPTAPYSPDHLAIANSVIQQSQTISGQLQREIAQFLDEQPKKPPLDPYNPYYAPGMHNYVR